VSQEASLQVCEVELIDRCRLPLRAGALESSSPAGGKAELSRLVRTSSPSGVRRGARYPAQTYSAGVLRLPADRCEGASALRDFASDALRTQASGDLVGMLEHPLRALEVLGPPAGDERAGPSGVSASEEQGSAKVLVDLGRGCEVGLAPCPYEHVVGGRAIRPDSYSVGDGGTAFTEACVTALPYASR
jgi:hypothetical protein